MSEVRSAYRRRLLKTGFIIVSDKVPKIPSALKNASEMGAALEVSTTVGIPGILMPSQMASADRLIISGEPTQRSASDLIRSAQLVAAHY